MQIETYEIEEIKGELGVMAADSESIEIISRLGLKGQLSMANTETATRQMFRKMTAEEMATYKVLLPQETKIDGYQSGPIPLRVLQLLDKAKESGFFRGFVVWHPEDVRKDPLLIGKAASPNPSWNMYEHMDDHYLIARWGEVLEPLDVLKAKAIRLWKATNTAKLKRLISRAKLELETIDEIATEYFENGKETELSTRYS